jgi:hypothetical protein
VDDLYVFETPLISGEARLGYAFEAEGLLLMLARREFEPVDPGLECGWLIVW